MGSMLLGVQVGCRSVPIFYTDGSALCSNPVGVHSDECGKSAEFIQAWELIHEHFTHQAPLIGSRHGQNEM
jgi:hypothetical protein